MAGRHRGTPRVDQVPAPTQDGPVPRHRAGGEATTAAGRGAARQRGTRRRSQSRGEYHLYFYFRMRMGNSIDDVVFL